MHRDKRTLIYEAALSLVDENLDLGSIKVADIAERANIGKGTVYEYFDSKEQVIGEAVIYMFKSGIEALEELIKENRSFRETYLFLLRNLSVTMSKNRSLFNLMTMNQKKMDLHTTIKDILYQQMEEIKQDYFEIIETLVEKSVREGIIKDKPAEYDWHTAVLSSLTSMVVHKQFQDQHSLAEEEILEKAYNIYIKLLS